MNRNPANNNDFSFLKNLTVNDIMKNIDVNKLCKIETSQRPKSELQTTNINNSKFDGFQSDYQKNNNKEEKIQQNEVFYTEISDIKCYASRADKYRNAGEEQLANNDLKLVTELYYQGKTEGLSESEKKVIEDSFEAQNKVEQQVHKLEQQVGKAVGTQKEKEDLKQNMEKLQHMVRGQVEKNTIQRMACLQDEPNIKKRENVQKEQDIQTEEVRQKMSLLVNSLGNNPKASEANEKILKQLEELQKKIVEQDQEIKKLQQDMIDGGVMEKVEVNRGFRRIEDIGGEQFNYCKTFYWTAINMIMAYRTLGTGLVQGNFKSDLNKFLSSNKELISYCVNKGVKSTSTYDTVKTGVKVAKGVLKAIPFVGRLVTAIDDIVSVVIEQSCNAFDKMELMKFEQRINAINKVIISKFGLEDQISIAVAKVAIKLTDLKKNQILDENYKNPFTTQSWFESKIKDVKSLACEQVEQHDYSSRGVVLAIRDVSLFISFICKNWHEIVYTNDEDIEKLIETVVLNNGFEKLVKDKTILIPKNKNNKKPKDKKKKCTIF